MKKIIALNDEAKETIRKLTNIYENMQQRILAEFDRINNSWMSCPDFIQLSKVLK